MIQPWHVWVVIALICIILEIFTAGFAVACFSAGALLAALGCALGLSLVWQVVVFAVVTFITFMYVRPLLIKLFFKEGSEKKTNADALIGRRGRVSVRIDPSKGEGRVAIDGDDWKATSEDGSTIEKGDEVEVKKIDSIILTVTKI